MAELSLVKIIGQLHFSCAQSRCVVTNTHDLGTTVLINSKKKTQMFVVLASILNMFSVIVVSYEYHHALSSPSHPHSP